MVMVLTFEAGLSSFQVSVPVVNDLTLEANEVFYGKLRSPNGHRSTPRVEFAPGTANVTILDDDRTKRSLMYFFPFLTELYLPIQMLSLAFLNCIKPVKGLMTQSVWIFACSVETWEDW